MNGISQIMQTMTPTMARWGKTLVSKEAKNIAAQAVLSTAVGHAIHTCPTQTKLNLQA